MPDTVTHKINACGSMRLKVVIVEDDPDLRSLLVEFLAELGQDVRGVNDGKELDALLETEPVDIIVLDVNLPGENGISIARRLYARQRYGIIMLTGRGEIEDKVHGLESGADVYLVKPVSPLELHASLLSLGRRMFPDRQPFWRVEVMRSLLIPPTGVEIPLSMQRCIVLEMLMAEPGRIVPRSNLLAALGHFDDEYGNHRLETLISRLRSDVRKSDPEAQLPIHARHNHGYAFHEEATILSPEKKSRYRNMS